jgi:hypothetical protein
MISIEVNDKAVIADLTGYSAKITRVAVRSLNRAIQSGKTAMTRDIARDTGLKVGDIKDAMPVVQATRERLMAVFGATLKRIGLIHFKARGPEPSRGRGRGVSYGLPGGRSRVADAFIAKMASGHPGVFKRTGRARLPIVELYGPSLGHVFQKYRPAGLARTREAFETAFDHELARLTTGQGVADE